MPLGVLTRPLARGVEQRRRRILAAKRPILAHIHPDAAGFRLAFCEDRNRGVVAMQPRGGQNMALNQCVQGAQAPTRSANVDRLRSIPSRA
jgi:hypothetical protein